MSSRSTQPARRLKKAATRSSYPKLRRLVATRKIKPPQHWYDQTDDPFAPKAKPR